jgi:hypothetical protein
MLRIVNMIPLALSGESNQDSEPNIAVDPQNPQHITGTAFTPDPLNGQRAPVFLSTNGGSTWQLRAIVPGGPSTRDISVGFASRGGTLYAGTLNYSTLHLNVLRDPDPFNSTQMTLLVDRPNEDQPWVSAATAAAGGADHDRVYIGHNDFNVGSQTASVESSGDARTAAPPSNFATTQVERGAPANQDGPPVRTAIHSGGTIYAAFQRWVSVAGSGPGFLDVNVDIIVVRDDNWAAGATPFSALSGTGGIAGVAVDTNRFVRFTSSTGPLGQERIGADLSIAVDPANSARVWVAWCDRVGGQNGTDWTLHLRHSNDSGATWSTDVRVVTNAKNPSVAINARGEVALLFQQLVGTGAPARWVTQLEISSDAWASPAANFVLHSALASAPARTFLPYLGDYVRLLAQGNDFYGVFSGSNLPDLANFPSGITFQRNANWTNHTLLAVNNTTTVPVSIDPFFFAFSAAGWHAADLTAATGAPVAVGDPCGYLFNAQGTQHVVFRSGDGHIRELWWEPTGGWHAADLTAVTGAPAAAGDPTGYVFDTQGSQHVMYRDGNGHIQELWWA